jgi:hypothetical protein
VPEPVNYASPKKTKKPVLAIILIATICAVVLGYIVFFILVNYTRWGGSLVG